MPLNLEEVPTLDLITEICERNEAVVLLSTNGEQWSHVMHGSGLLCSGLVQYALKVLSLVDVRQERVIIPMRVTVPHNELRGLPHKEDGGIHDSRRKRTR